MNRAPLRSIAFIAWSGVAEELQPDRKRRRRSGTVDYKALDEQLRAEHEAEGDKPADIKPE